MKFPTRVVVAALFLVLVLPGARPAAASNDDVTVTSDLLLGIQVESLVADTGTTANLIEHTLVVPVPDLGDAPETVQLSVAGAFTDLRVRGKMQVKVIRRRTGATREVLARTKIPFAPGALDSADSIASGQVEIASDDLAAGDRLEVEFSPSDDADVPAGTELSFSTRWSTDYAAGASRAGAAVEADEVSVTEESQGWARIQGLELDAGATLGGVERALEIPIPDLSSFGDHDTMQLFYTALVLNTVPAPARGRLSVKLLRYPADGGGRDRIGHASVKMTHFNIRGVITFPVPDGLGLGDRIVAELVIKSDAVADTNGSSMVVSAQLVLGESGRLAGVSR